MKSATNMLQRGHQYRKLGEESPSGLQDGEMDTNISDGPPQPRPHRRYLPHVLGFLLALSVFLNVLTLVSNRTRDLDDVCSLYTSQSQSPISEDVKISYSTKEFTGSFMNSSAYTQDPSPKVDQEWLALGTQARHFRVPTELASYYGLDPGHAQYLESQGGGYPVLFEFSHHLHCVNLLRQALYWNFDYYTSRGEGPFANEPHIVKVHVNHCVDILRQVIMCQPDTGVFGQYWVEEIGQPFVDFRTRHKCKNFDELRDWVMDHQVSDEFAAEAGVVPGDVILDHIP